MRLAILGATGRTGTEVVRQALERGHHVVALARAPERVQRTAAFAEHPRLTLARADVLVPGSLSAAVDGSDALLGTLGTGPRDAHDTLWRGAEEAVATGIKRIVWLGALGTGASGHVAGPLLGPVLRLALGKEITEKVRADARVVAAGHTVVHAGRLTTSTATGGYRLVPADLLRPSLWPSSVPRADVAALMLEHAEGDPAGGDVGETLVTTRS